MKRLLLLCAIGLSLVMFGCRSAAPIATVTSTAIAQATPNPTATPIPPTVDKANTPIPTLTATSTGTPTTTRTPRPAKPQPTLTPTAGPSPTLPPPPSGSIIFLWDPNPWSNMDPGLKESRYNLYVAYPGETIFEWQSYTLQEGFYGRPVIALSTDETTLAMTVLEDKNEDGHIGIESAKRGFDAYNLFTYALNTGDITRLTDDYQIGNPHWIPNTDSVSFARFGQVFSIDINDFGVETLIDQLPDGVDHLSWSPDGAYLAIELQTGLLLLYDIAEKEMIYLDNIPLGKSFTALWSSNGDWVLSSGSYSSGLFVVNIATREIFTLVDAGHFSLGAWSPDNQYLAYSKSQRSDISGVLDTSIFLWDTATGVSHLLISELKTKNLDLVWSPDGKQLVIGHLTNEGADVALSLFEVSTGKITTVWQSHFKVDYPDSFSYPLGWSPNGQWLLFFAWEIDQESIVETLKAGVYIVHRSGSEPILIVDTSGEQTRTFNPYGFYWLSETPFLVQDNE